MPAGLLHLEGDEAHLLCEFDTGAFKHSCGEFVTVICTAGDKGGECRKIGAGTGVAHLHDFAERFGTPEFSDFCEQGGWDAAIFGPEAGAEGLLSDPKA